MNKKPLIFTFVSISLFFASVRAADGEQSNDAPSAESDQQGGWSLWPKDIAGRIVGQAAQQSAVHADRLTKENIRVANQAAQERLDQANAHAKDLVDHTGNRLDQTVERTLQREGPLDQATNRVLGQATQHLETTANHVVADATGQLQDASHQILTQEVQPVGHELIVDLAQSVGKMFLSGTMGIFGAVLTYKGLIDYLEAQSNEKKVYAKWQDQQREKYKDHEGTGAATLLSNKLKAAGLINSGDEQKARACLVGAGLTSFAASCILCCYWIR